MKKKIKNEELYSRREFFKKAVKTALPIIATVVLVSNPVASKAAKVAMGCESYCTGVTVPAIMAVTTPVWELVRELAKVVV